MLQDFLHNRRFCRLLRDAADHDLCGYGGIGRRARFRFWWETVQVQVLLSAGSRTGKKEDASFETSSFSVHVYGVSATGHLFQLTFLKGRSRLFPAVDTDRFQTGFGVFGILRCIHILEDIVSLLFFAVCSIQTEAQSL